MRSVSLFASITQGVSCSNADFSSWFLARFDLSASGVRFFHDSNTALIFGLELAMYAAMLLDQNAVKIPSAFSYCCSFSEGSACMAYQAGFDANSRVSL